MGERQIAFHGGSGREPQALADIGEFEVRILGEDLTVGEAASQQTKHRRHRYSQVPNTGNTAHLPRIDGDTFEVLHVTIVASWDPAVVLRVGG